MLCACAAQQVVGPNRSALPANRQAKKRRVLREAIAQNLPLQRLGSCFYESLPLHVYTRAETVRQIAERLTPMQVNLPQRRRRSRVPQRLLLRLVTFSRPVIRVRTLARRCRGQSSVSAHPGCPRKFFRRTPVNAGRWPQGEGSRTTT